MPISDLQSKARQIVDQVQRTEVPMVITRRGRAAAVLLDYATYEGLLAMQDEMSFPDWRKRLERAEKEFRSGRAVALEDYMRKRAKRA
ncbi:MAG: type II toxin-antitoxin system Phd/YefM family antitoxin [Elusimicrobia bacterium]|nr:type II toxin-antitoxin system Phd/YefM family antitoxin [Elusimicrobiota bacterium]